MDWIKKNKFKIGIGILVAVVLIVVICVIGTNLYGNGNNNSKVNSKENKQTSATIDNFLFEVTDTSFEDGTSEFDIKITNKTDEAKYLGEISVLVKDENGNTIVSLAGVVEQDIDANSDITIICAYGGDLSNYNSIDFEVK